MKYFQPAEHHPWLPGQSHAHKDQYLPLQSVDEGLRFSCNCQHVLVL